MEGRAVATRRGPKEAASKKPQMGIDEKPNLQAIKDTVLNIESLYTDTGLPW